MGNKIGPVKWVFDKDDLREMVETLEGAPEVVFDLETTGLDEHATLGGLSNGGYPARVVLATFTVEITPDEEPLTYVVPLHHPWSPFLGKWRVVLTYIAQRLRKTRKALVGHNIKFDVRWVYAHTGVDLSGQIVWDTQVSSHLLDENESTRLKTRAATTFGIEEWDEFDLKKPGAAERVDLWVLGDYGAEDTYWTFRLYRYHRSLLDWENEWPISPDEVEDARLGLLAKWCAMPMVASLTRVEERGFALDSEWVAPELTLHQIGANSALDALSAIFEMDRESATTAATSKWFKAMTTEAVEQGLLRVTALTDSGNPQWNKSVLKRQSRAGSQVADLVLEHRNHAKKAEFLQSWLEHLSPDGRVHASYHAGRVITGRLSCSDPNMQQVTKVLKPAFVAKPGHVIIDLDYSQIELRVAAYISRCEPMLQAYRDDRDLHRMMGAKITGKKEAKVSDDERQGGKSANFGLLYGMQAEGFRDYAEDVYDVHYSLDQAYDVREAFFTLWDGLADWHERVIAIAHRDGQVTSPIGRVRRVPGVHADEWGLRSYAERQAINSPVQGFASDLMQIAAASIQGLLPGDKPVRGAAVVGTVHDSIIVEAPEKEWVRVAMECQHRMTKRVIEVVQEMGAFLDVPLVADATAGSRWGLTDVGVIE